METAWDDLWHAELVSIRKWVDCGHERTHMVSVKASVCHNIHTGLNVFNRPNLWEGHIPKTLDRVDQWIPAVCARFWSCHLHVKAEIKIHQTIRQCSIIQCGGPAPSVTLTDRRKLYHSVLLLKPISFKGLTYCAVRDYLLHLGVVKSVILFICDLSTVSDWTDKVILIKGKLYGPIKNATHWVFCTVICKLYCIYRIYEKNTVYEDQEIF